MILHFQSSIYLSNESFCDKYNISSLFYCYFFLWWPPSHNFHIDLMGLTVSLFLCKCKERDWHIQWIAVFVESLSFAIVIGIKRMLFKCWLNEWMTYYYRWLCNTQKYIKDMNIVKYQYRWRWVSQVLIFPSTTVLLFPSNNHRLSSWEQICYTQLDF